MVGRRVIILAERVGFEPTLEFPLNTLSKRAPSATRPSLHGIHDKHSSFTNVASLEENMLPRFPVYQGTQHLGVSAKGESAWSSSSEFLTIDRGDHTTNAELSDRQ